MYDSLVVNDRDGVADAQAVDAFARARARCAGPPIIEIEIEPREDSIERVVTMYDDFHFVVQRLMNGNDGLHPR